MPEAGVDHLASTAAAHPHRHGSFRRVVTAALMSHDGKSQKSHGAGIDYGVGHSNAWEGKLVAYVSCGCFEPRLSARGSLRCYWHRTLGALHACRSVARRDVSLSCGRQRGQWGRAGHYHREVKKTDGQLSDGRNLAMSAGHRIRPLMGPYAAFLQEVEKSRGQAKTVENLPWGIGYDPLQGRLCWTSRVDGMLMKMVFLDQIRRPVPR